MEEQINIKMVRVRSLMWSEQSPVYYNQQMHSMSSAWNNCNVVNKWGPTKGSETVHDALSEHLHIRRVNFPMAT